jgi:hypothetical protein
MQQYKKSKQLHRMGLNLCPEAGELRPVGYFGRQRSQGFEVVRQLGNFCFLSTIWFSSTNADPEVVRAAFRADAIGYVS